MKKIIFLPHSPRNKILYDNLEYGIKKKKWLVTAINDESQKDYFVNTLGFKHFISYPNLTVKQEWESNQSYFTKLCEIISECEKLVGFSLNKIFLSGERMIGRFYTNENIYLPHSKLSKYTFDNKINSTLVLLRLFNFFYKIIEETKPDYFISGSACNIWHLVVSIISKYKNIKILINRPSKIFSNRNFWTEDIYMFNEKANFVFNKINKNSISQYSKRHLEKFKAKPSTIKYVKSNWANKRQGTFQITKNYLINYISNIINKRFTNKLYSELLHESVRINLFSIFHKNFASSYDESFLSANSYAYLALHKEPELALNFQNTSLHSQRNLIQTISHSLPFGFKLLVRDHPLNSGRRYSSFYESLIKIPNLYFIKSTDPQYKYIKNANIIITDNGTTGFEGVIFGKPVISLAKSFYEFTNITRKVRDLNNLSSEILDILDKGTCKKDLDSIQLKVLRLIEAEYRTTFKDDDKKSLTCLI